MANYPVPYTPGWGNSFGTQPTYPVYSGAAMPQTVPQSGSTPTGGIVWVDGEVGAKAYQMPQGWPAGQPIALWDTNDTVIYLKSISPMGMPNPLQKAHYTLENVSSGERNRGYSGDVKTPDMSEYVRKEDMEKMKAEIMDALGSSGTGRRAAKGEAI